MKCRPDPGFVFPVSQEYLFLRSSFRRSIWVERINDFSVVFLAVNKCHKEAARLVAHDVFENARL